METVVIIHENYPRLASSELNKAGLAIIPVDMAVLASDIHKTSSFFFLPVSKRLTFSTGHFPQFFTYYTSGFPSNCYKQIAPKLRS
jgi:hypothetical protein